MANNSNSKLESNLDTDTPFLEGERFGEDRELVDKQEAIKIFKKQYLSGDIKSARETLALIRMDHHPKIVYYSGLLEMKDKDYDKAINHFKKIISHEKSNFITIQSYICLGLIFSTRGQYKLSLMYLDILVDSGIESAQIYSMIGYCHMELKQYDDSLVNYEKALDFDIENENTLNSLGYLLVLLGQLEKGYTYIKKALEKNPNNYAFIHSMGMYYLVNKNYKNALNLFEKAINIKKNPLILEHINICKKRIKSV